MGLFVVVVIAVAVFIDCCGRRTGFASAHMMTFGNRVFAYRNLTSSTLALLRSLVRAYWLPRVTATMCVANGKEVVD